MDIEYQGKIVDFHNLAHENNIPPNILYSRLRNSWPIEKALKTPVRPKRKNRTTIESQRPPLVAPPLTAVLTEEGVANFVSQEMDRLKKLEASLTELKKQRENLARLARECQVPL